MLLDLIKENDSTKSDVNIHLEKAWTAIDRFIDYMEIWSIK